MAETASSITVSRQFDVLSWRAQRYRGVIYARHVGPCGSSASLLRPVSFANMSSALTTRLLASSTTGLPWWRFISGWSLSWVMRFHLAWTNAAIPGLQWLSNTGAPGGLMTPEYYLQLMTMHGTIMVFFVLTTAPFAGFGNFFLPIQVGAEDMPFPHFNMMSFWVTFVAFCVADLGILRGRWTAAFGLDRIRASERRWVNRRTRTRHRPGSVGCIHRFVLRGAVVGLPELHLHHARHALPRA